MRSLAHLFQKRDDIWDYANTYNLPFGMAFIEFYDEGWLRFNDVDQMPLGLFQLREIRAYLYNRKHDIRHLIEARIDRRERNIIRKEKRKARRRKQSEEG